MKDVALTMVGGYFLGIGSSKPLRVKRIFLSGSQCMKKGDVSVISKNPRPPVVDLIFDKALLFIV